MKRWLSLTLAVVIFFLVGCSDASRQEYIRPTYQSYREIPGVTQEDIEAIEELLIKKPDLVYGFPLSTEAFYNDDGSVGGFVALLYGRMSELFGFNFYPQAYEWDELLERFDAHEIDFVGDFTPTPERQERYFMTEPFIQRSIMVFANKNNDSLENIAKTRAIRCGFIKGTTTYETVADSWKLPFEPVFIDGESEVVDCFINGEIDAYIDDNVMKVIFDSCDFIESREYYPLKYSPISLTTANPELAPIIDVMQKYLKNGGLAELAQLYNQGHKDYLRHKFSAVLTEEEKAYIQRHNTDNSAILMACETDNYPSCFYNSKEREFQGTAIDVMSKVAELTELRFRTGNQPNTPWSELLEGLEKGEYSVITELLQTGNRKDRFLWPEMPYYTNNYALISRAEYPEIDINQILFHRVGLVEDSAFSDVFFEWFPGSVDTVMYTNNSEAIDALESGEVDLLMMSQNLLLHITNYLEKPYFKANVVFSYSTGSYFGFNKDEEILRSIIEKAQGYVDTDGISESWKRKVFDYESKMLRDMIPYWVAASLLLSATLFVIFVLLLKNRRTNKNLGKLVAERTNELALQTATLVTVFESIPDLIFCKDENLIFTRVNRSYAEHVGILEADIIGKDDSTAFDIADELVANYREVDSKIIRDGQPVVVEEVICAADGSFPLFETIKIPLMHDGQAIGIVGISRDITQRKAAEDILKVTLDNLDTCIYITEIDTGKILFVNERMAEEFGGNVRLGDICWEVLQSGITERCEFCPVPHLLESGDEYCIWEEHNTVTKKHYRNTDSLIQWPDGSLVHMQHSVDVTAAIELQRNLEEASRAKGDFLARMSHEIRTPLNAIIGMNNIALSSNDLDRIHQCHEKIDTASKHLLGVINDILDMSKIEADKFELSNSKFYFEKMLRSVINVNNFRAEEKSQELVVNLSKYVPPILVGDDLRLSQVITNLLSNSIKFTPDKGSIILNIEKIAEEGNDVTLRIEVVDNGIGVSQEQQERLFSSFEQADGSISRKFGGTGLGLAISKRIVELMGGTIWVESELGKGSKFAFTTIMQKSESGVREQLSADINKRNLRILAVDDSEETLMSFSHMMDAHGLPYDVADSGSAALELIKNSGDRPYNIFFIDWRMPEMDGIELTGRIKEITGDSAVVFMISVVDWNSIEKEARAAGVESFIPKPLFSSSVIDAINECLGVESAKADLDAQDMDVMPNFSTHSILIAEDIEINREITSAILEETGISIDFAENGREAVSLFLGNPNKYGLILMDIQMPEMDGYEATRIIRALEFERAKDIPVIAMTANVFKEDIENCLSAGMNDHIGKPVDVFELFDKLKQYLK